MALLLDRAGSTVHALKSTYRKLFQVKRILVVSEYCTDVHYMLIKNSWLVMSFPRTKCSFDIRTLSVSFQTYLLNFSSDTRRSFAKQLETFLTCSGLKHLCTTASLFATPNRTVSHVL
jgi:hypothetical protein